MKHRKLIGVAAAAALVLAACGGGTGGSPAPSLVTEVGAGEGVVTTLNWAGYVEDGSTYPEYNWVAEFEQKTGCDVQAQSFYTSDEAYSLMTTNPEQFDVISASGDASKRLAVGGYVQPVNTDLVPNYADIIPALKDKPWNTFDGVHYGIPHGRGANLLMWQSETVNPPPANWAAMFDPSQPFSGKVSVYDAPIYIADAAVVLMKTRPELGIKNPYALDQTQFDAAVDLLKQQKPMISQYWTDYTKQIEAFAQGDATVATTWQVIANLLTAGDPPTKVETVKPEEGATGWSDTWMINSKTKHPNCAYMFLDWIVSPKTNAQIADYFGEAPANAKSCELTPAEFTPTVSVTTTMADHCALFHAAEDGYWTDVYYWTTPEETCLDGRTDVKCVGFDKWIEAWTQIRG
jgi:putative spermidine/putrescine transport system substrate-binding protein